MGKSFRTLLLAMTATLAVASCTENLPEDITRTTEDSKVYLKIGSVSTSELTKSAIEGTKFPTADAASIGIFLGDTKNAATTKAAGSDTWSDPQIELPAEETTLYGYYPYSEDVTSISSISVSSSVDGDDWMWATPVTGVSSANPDVSLSMNHALALVEITFNITGYAESAKMTNVTLTGKSFIAEGTLDATNRTITPKTAYGSVNEFSEAVSLSQTDSKIVAKCLLVPTGLDGRQDMTIACTLDGKNLKATLSGDKGVIVKSGTKSTVSLNVKGTTMEVAEVGVSGWNDGVTTAIVSGHSVTVSSTDIPAAITAGTDITTDDESVEKASQTATITYDKSVLADGKYGVGYSCSPSGVCTVNHNAEAGTITVSNVTADVTITLSKKVNWYDVTITTEGNGSAYIGTAGTTAARCNVGSSITLTASPGPAEDFIGWQDAAGTSLSTNKSYTYTPSVDIAVKAVFTTRILSGEFTVGTGRKVRFSGGNLWYDGSKFLFEAEQYQSSPSSTGNRSDSHISHFMWCGTAADALALQYYNDRAEEFFASDGLDVYGSTALQVLPYDGYLNLLYYREASTVCGTENARWFNGQVNTGSGTVNGLFLFPDVFSWPETVTVKPATINTWAKNYSNCTFTLDQFQVLEKAGIVFLPAAGSRSGTDGAAEVKSVNTTGSYWSSGFSGTDGAEYISFNASRLIASEISAAHSNTYRYMAQSVRLVIDVTE